MPSHSSAKKTTSRSVNDAISATKNSAGDWILALIIIIIVVIALLIYTPRYQASVDKFINLDLQYQNIGGIYNSFDSKLIKWNADNFQKLQLTFRNPGTTQISKIKLDFKDVNNNNLYTYSYENTTPGNLVFPFKLNLPSGRAYILLVYLNDNAQPTFIKDINTDENYFNFTDITNQNLPETADAILSVKITNPDTNQQLTEDTTNTRKRNLGTLKMQPYNMVSIPVTIPVLSAYKNLLKSSTSTNPDVKAAHDDKIDALDNFVFKEIEAAIMVIGTPQKTPITTKADGAAPIATMNAMISQEYDDYGISADELTKFEREFPNRVKVITPGADGCVQGDSNKCAVVVKNLVSGAKYKLVIRAVYQQLGSVEPNIRYTKPQTVIFSVSSDTNQDTDLNKTFNIVDKAKQYIINQEQKEFITRDQNRQDYSLLNLETDVRQLSNKIYYSL
jgi:hypothetical protein